MEFGGRTFVNRGTTENPIYDLIGDGDSGEPARSLVLASGETISYKPLFLEFNFGSYYGSTASNYISAESDIVNGTSYDVKSGATYRFFNVAFETTVSTYMSIASTMIPVPTVSNLNYSPYTASANGGQLPNKHVFAISLSELGGLDGTKMQMFAYIFEGKLQVFSSMQSGGGNTSGHPFLSLNSGFFEVWETIE